jgi:hypothetical protein
MLNFMLTSTMRVIVIVMSMVGLRDQRRKEVKRAAGSAFISLFFSFPLCDIFFRAEGKRKREKATEN